MSERLRQKRNGRNRSTSNRNMREDVARRKANPSEPRKFPNKDNVHPVKPGPKGGTSNDPRDPVQLGKDRPQHARRRGTPQK
jgi:hypothetical protein